MLIDCDPQGSTSLWHKLRGTAEPQLRDGSRGGVKEFIERATADGIEWAFVDTPPNMSPAVTDAIMGVVKDMSIFMGKVMSLFMNCDKMVGGQFEKGLAQMKTIVESRKK